ncbi:MAG: DUF3880 domain-containing protein [Lachnospiraceae bacterium]|nr:DUF3880 domain-containing protein [Lachnospiraceae bacterium]
MQLGTEVERSSLRVTLNLPVDSEIEFIKNEVVKYNCVVTQNFSVNVAIACFEKCVPYISWIYDSPQVSLYTEHAKYPTNFIFAFDKAQVSRLRAVGINNIFYMPLAANMAYTSRINISKQDRLRYGVDISFIGQLYRLDYLKTYTDNASKEIVDTLKKIVGEKAFDWRKGQSIYDTIPNDIVDKISINDSDFEYFNLIGNKFIKETILLGPMIANREREGILSSAGERFKTALYTKESDKEYAGDVLEMVKVFGPVSGEEPYKIYACSKLNLNLTLRTIETAVPQRVFDIMSMGGTVISNYQEEAEELFVPDKEIILFESLEEFVEKTAFYLDHPDIRKKIGERGYRAVKEKYNYVVALNKMFDIVINTIG